MGKPRSSSFLRISMPTAPVAPATPTRGLRMPFFAAVARVAVRALVVPTCVYTLRIADACDSLCCVRPARRMEDATVDAMTMRFTNAEEESADRRPSSSVGGQTADRNYTK